ncbi:methyltransferase family protein [Nocardioides terrigena]|uniref:methyltransferase family protein n=1 Tax=Nocardioides terrigena TaxID=424797 RepID=UPI000D327368|nr:isoprenylcysteine carboxylmethyltransferase family protein [Nocardioides terrigena]
MDHDPAPQDSRRIDVGRVVAVTAFTLLLTLNVLRLASGEPFSHAFMVVNTGLALVFYLLLIAAYLRRVPSSRTDRRWSSWLVALLGTCAPFAIPLVSQGPREGGPLALVAAVVLGLGLLAMLWALGSLGTNISVVPQARAVVSHGPYARVRHPLYAAELVNVLGLCLASTGPGPWVVMAALITFQVVRARREEELLSRELPGYADYKSHTPMLVPALGRS